MKNFFDVAGGRVRLGILARGRSCWWHRHHSSLLRGKETWNGISSLFWKLIRGIGTGGSAGFGMKDLTWYQYLFTQFRAIFVYIGNFVLPVYPEITAGLP